MCIDRETIWERLEETADPSQDVITARYPIFRRGINSGGQTAPVTLSYLRESRYPGTVYREARQIRTPASPTEAPQACDTVANPHRNPTNETAHSGTLVMRVTGLSHFWDYRYVLWRT